MDHSRGQAINVPSMQDDSDLRLDGLSSGSEKDPEGSVSAEAAQKHEQQDEPPNGGYGWVCVACVALINAHTWGINSSYGVFLAYCERDPST